MRSARILRDFSVLPPALGRREVLIGAGAVGMALATEAIVPALAQSATGKPDYALRITPVSLELAPGKVIKTFGYNGMAPGPVLRLPEGRAVSFEISNETDIDDIVHWSLCAVRGRWVHGRGHADGSARRRAGATPLRRSRRAPAGITAIISPERTCRAVRIPACSDF